MSDPIPSSPLHARPLSTPRSERVAPSRALGRQLLGPYCAAGRSRDRRRWGFATAGPAGRAEPGGRAALHPPLDFPARGRSAPDSQRDAPVDPEGRPIHGARTLEPRAVQPGRGDGPPCRNPRFSCLGTARRRNNEPMAPSKAGDSRGTNRLLRRAADGDGAGWGALLTRHEARLRRMVAFRLDPRLRGRIDPEDVLQEVHLAASEHRDDYLRRPTLPFFLWLRGIAGHK